MQSYTPFVERINHSLGIESTYATDGMGDNSSSELLRGETAAAALRRLVPLETLRSIGSFFTSSGMAEMLWSDSLETLDGESIIVDPACGAGDLLIPPLRQLLRNGVKTTVTEQIRGIDLQSGFVSAARARLRLCVQNTDPRDVAHEFHRILQRDFFKSYKSILQDATHVVLNPPFISTAAPEDCSWGTNQINAAALFVDLSISASAPGTRILAILPEVLRSGSRYAKWRNSVLERASEISITSLGQFDSKTDIDVFKLVLVTCDETSPEDEDSNSPTAWQPELNHNEPNASTVQDHFDVKVGPVVPHRHASEGTPVPYVTAKGLPSWTVIEAIEKSRGFSGRTHSGPFVVIRRTSRPGEQYRARATVIDSPGEIAVENHLIVLIPYDNSVETCIKLMGMLKQEDVTSFLNHRIKCRHLTVSSIKEIPWH